MDSNDQEFLTDPDFDLDCYGEVTIDVGNLDLSNISYGSTILGGSGSSGSFQGYSQSNQYVTLNNSGWASQPSNFTVSTTAQNTAVAVNESGLNVKEGADIRIGNRSLSEFMDKVAERLAILQPDPAKLEKHTALRKAYEHYKTLERLIGED